MKGNDLCQVTAQQVALTVPKSTPCSFLSLNAGDGFLLENSKATVTWVPGHSGVVAIAINLSIVTKQWNCFYYLLIILQPGLEPSFSHHSFLFIWEQWIFEKLLRVFTRKLLIGCRRKKYFFYISFCSAFELGFEPPAIV